MVDQDDPIYRSMRKSLATRNGRPLREIVAYHSGSADDYVVIHDAVAGTDMALTVQELGELARAARLSVQNHSAPRTTARRRRRPETGSAV